MATIREFCEAYKAKNFMNTPQGVQERVEWIKKESGAITYIPFMAKREIAETVVEQNIHEVDGIKKYDAISAYIGLVVASIMAHTTLEFSDNPIEDYDLLAESGLLAQLVTMFQESHNEIDILLKMALAVELEDNNISAIIAKFLNKISEKLGEFGDTLKDKVEELDIGKLLGPDIKQEDLAKLSGLLDIFK